MVDELADGRPIPLPEAFNSQDREPPHFPFVGGSTMLARVRGLVNLVADYLSDARER